ncbi:formate dehydrogenase subunit gamma [Roseiterribacter gracilis]|uniref:NADH-quinone oxidoreductase subunit E n=1 Tax=Roseiterribacter gracilis TaxID=2812848 RepID=A0A8S8XJJ5_9PROT|nr:NADH-quinone oxidoreductase subunit E [Rhodospirillales bacterium TMPK1]
MPLPRYEAWSSARGAEVIAAHAHMEGATLPILHALQEEFGYVPVEAEPMIAHALNLSRAEVHGVVSFYHDFRRAPAGRHVLKLCRAEACQSVGADALHEHACKKLGVAPLGTMGGETTADGAVTVEQVFCLGLCASGPSAMLDGKPIGRLNRARLDTLLDRARAR